MSAQLKPVPTDQDGQDGQDGQDFVFVNEVESEPDDLEVDGAAIEKTQKWLNHTDYLHDSSEYQKHLRSHISGTNLWTKDTDPFRKWHDSPSHGSLWIKATAGVGKSVFAAVTASQLAQEENVPVLFFFFRQIIATNHDPNYLARDFISQVLPHSQSLQKRMRRLIDKGRSSESVPTSEFWSHLLDSLDALSKVYCIIDGLDEMDMAREVFLNSLVELGKRKPSSIKILMTSRPLPWIEARLKNPSVLQLRLNRAMVDRDISTYVGHRLRHRSDLSDDVKAAFRQSMESKANGSFLYARLMMDELMEHLRNIIPDIAYIQRSLSWLPQNLEEMYDGMLLDHSLRSHVPQELQVAILRCVTHSTRPLRLIELTAMLHYIPSNDKNHMYDPESLRYQSTAVLKERKSLIRNACGPLLEILPDETISIIHHSFTEYLTDTGRLRKSSAVHPQFPVILPIPTHYILAYACLRYMGYLDDWDIRPFTVRKPQQINDDILQLHDFNIRFPLIKYAIGNWYVHLRALEVQNHDYINDPASCTGKTEVFESLSGFFHSNERHRCLAWIDLTWSRRPGPMGGLANPKYVEPLHVAASCGLTSYARHLLACGTEVISSSRQAQRLTPLMLASENGFLDMVELLIAHDPQVDHGEVPYYFKPLRCATQANRHLIVRRLLVAGASPTVTVKRRHIDIPEGARNVTPLYLACTTDAVESLVEMIPYIPPERLSYALHYAIEGNKVAAVEALLASPYVYPNGDNEANCDGRPLYHAVRKGNPLIVKALLSKGADPNQTSGFKLTPLHALTQHSYTHLQNEIELENWKKCFHQLIKAGADINSSTEDGQTALHFAVALQDKRLSYELSELLLERGADPNVRDERGNTVLHNLRIESDATPMISLLIKHQADTSIGRNNDGETPLHSIITKSYAGGNLQPILHYFRDYQAKDPQGNTALHLAIVKLIGAVSADRVQSYAKMVTDLLGAGCDPTNRNDDGLTPLLLLFSYHHSFRSSSDRSCWESFYDQLRRQVIPTLLQHGDSLETTDYDGRTILLRAVTELQLDHGILVPMLLDMGAAKDARDHEGNTVLHLLCKKGGSVALFEYLADKGVDFFAVNHAGNTLLHEIGRAHSLNTLLQFLLRRGLSATARNNLGQSPLHMICGIRRSNDSLQPILKSRLVKCLEIYDRNGIRPIHLAASISESYVRQLVESGADATAKTLEGRTTLHIACQARQPNIVGYLLDHYSLISQPHIIDIRDRSGRTAIHDACRSGRPESVRLLLDAGATLKNEISPLFACTEHKDEEILWSSMGRQLLPKPILDAAGILVTDPRRPPVEETMPWKRPSIIASPNPQPTKGSHLDTESTRIGEIVMMLLHHGADVFACAYGKSVIEKAICSECESILDVLLPYAEEKHSSRLKGSSTIDPHTTVSRRDFAEEHLRLRSIQLPKLLQSKIIPGQDNIVVCSQLLALEKYDIFEKLVDMGVDFTPRPGPDSFLHVLASRGYASLLKTLGRTVKQPWVDGVQSAEKDKRITPFLMVACARELPNLDVIRVLVEDFGANVNCEYIPMDRLSFDVLHAPLHELAKGKEWWKLSAMKYLLDHGADPNLESSKTEMSQSTMHYVYNNREKLFLLLQHGLDPNSIGGNGYTCLREVLENVDQLRFLVQVGVDVNAGSKHIIFSAIEKLNIVSLRVLLELGANCNTVYPKRPAEELERNGLYYDCPLSYAAAKIFNTPKYRRRATDIIRILLEHGANPYENIASGGRQKTVLHHLFEHGEVLQPFYEIKKLDLELRDSSGRTLLLAASLSKFGTTSPQEYAGMPISTYLIKDDTVSDLLEEDPTEPEILPANRLYNLGSNLLVQDNDGNNVLHHLLANVPCTNSRFDEAIAAFIKDAPIIAQQKNKAGLTPLHVAIATKRIWPINILIAAGADIQEPSPDGNTVLHHLADSLNDLGTAKNFQNYIEQGVCINAINSNGETPIFSYLRHAEHEYDETLRDIISKDNPHPIRTYVPIFLKAGADFFHKNNKGETLLHILAKRMTNPESLSRFSMIAQQTRADVKKLRVADTVDAFRLLMDMGLDPMVEDNALRTSLDVAAACGNGEILDLLRED